MNTSEQPQGDKALLAIRETVILERECHAFKNATIIDEVKAMRFDVGRAFRF